MAILSQPQWVKLVNTIATTCSFFVRSSATTMLTMHDIRSYEFKLWDVFYEYFGEKLEIVDQWSTRIPTLYPLNQYMSVK